jgi:hypothetical protein
MTTTDTITDRQIREYLLEDSDHNKVVIKRNGEVHVHTDRQRGDGGRRPWWMFAGFRRDLVRDIQSRNY